MALPANQCHSPHGLQRMRLAAYVYAWGFQEIKNLIANLSKNLVNKKATVFGCTESSPSNKQVSQFLIHVRIPCFQTRHLVPLTG